MTLDDLKKEKKELERRLEKVEQDIAGFNTTLHLSDPEAEFRKWSLYEQSELYNINEDACKWFYNDLERQHCTIEDYNRINPDKKITFVKA